MKHHFGRSILLTAVLASVTPLVAAPPTINCGGTAAPFNTAWNGSAGTLTSGNDLNWEVLEVASSSAVTTLPTAGYGAAVVVSSPPMAWYIPPSGAGWIAHSSTGNHTNDENFFFRFRFNLAPLVNPAGFQLNINYFADNSVYEVWVNGVRQSVNGGGTISAIPNGGATPFLYQGFLNGSQASMVLNSNWQSGSNEVVVQILSSQSGEGFLANVTGNISCTLPPLNPTPTLSEFGLVGLTALLALAGMLQARNNFRAGL